MKKEFIIVLLNILLLLSFSCSINEHDCIEGNCSNGKGTSINSKSEKYIGEFANGKFHGIGTLLLPDGRKYEGEWNKGILEGKGTMHYPNGDVYKGEFKNFKVEGYGVMTNPNGAMYEGYFKDDSTNPHALRAQQSMKHLQN